MERNKEKKVIIISGPTCTGKTSLALKLCQKTGGEIVSADSRQVYKFMDIGTGKLPLQESHKIVKKNNVWNIDGINVWGYDLVTLDNYFSAYDYALFALAKITELIEKGKTVYIVGGTGFYIDIITKKITPSFVKPDFELRQSLENLVITKLAEKLKNINSEVFEKTDIKNRPRIIRALEREMLKKPTNSLVEGLSYVKNIQYVYTGLNAPNDYLFSQADKWVDNAWKNGVVDEINNLIKLGYKDSPKLSGLIYKNVMGFLFEGEKEQETLQKIKYAMHAYIRRQLTWFRKNESISWFDISVLDQEKIIAGILKI